MSKSGSLMALVPALALSAGGARAQVACGDTITGKVTLTADLSCLGNGLVIGADRTTLDLGGFTLQGNATGVGVDNGGGFDGVTVQNGRVEQFDEGISLGADAQKNVVRDVVVFSCIHDGIDLNDSDLARITGVLVTGNSAAGIQIGIGATGNLVEKSYAIGNATSGIQIEGSGNTVRNSDATANADGIVVLGDDNTLSGNGIYRNYADGIRVEGDDDALSKNYATGNVLDGIELRGAARATLEKNESSGNRELGILVAASSDGAILRKNTTTGNSVHGVGVEADCDSALLERNASRGNLLTGIDVQNASATLRKNTADANFGRGIAAPVGVLDAGGNRASHNPDEDCSPSVACN